MGSSSSVISAVNQALTDRLCSDLPASIQELEDLRGMRISWPPLDRKFNPPGKGLMAVMDEEMGFLD